MSKSLATLTVAAGLAAALLCACSSSGSQASTTLPSSVTKLSPFSHALEPATKFSKYLYVTDSDFNAVFLFKKKTWKNVGSITDGLSGPFGDWVDRHGNLYVANRLDVNILEYKPGSTTPTFTYSAGMMAPVKVTVDGSGNVYEADNNGAFVNEYAQKSNSVMFSCHPGGFLQGVAVDGSGDVFVDYNINSTGDARIAEYKGGLNGCNETVLGVVLPYAGGIALDKKNNLLVCEYLGGGAVDIIPPPYNGITGSLGSGFAAPIEVTLNKSNSQAYVTDWLNADVQVLNYPSGSNVVTLGSADGLIGPTGAVDGKNFVP